MYILYMNVCLCPNSVKSYRKTPFSCFQFVPAFLPTSRGRVKAHDHEPVLGGVNAVHGWEPREVRKTRGSARTGY